MNDRRSVLEGGRAVAARGGASRSGAGAVLLRSSWSRRRPVVDGARTASGPSIGDPRLRGARRRTPSTGRRATPPPGLRRAPGPAAERVNVRAQGTADRAVCCSTSGPAPSSGSATPSEELAIASLTKMMTALLVATDSKPGDRVLITPAATHFSGSGVGLLPQGKRVPLLPLLYGLLLPSGNDAAIALAQHVAGTQARFIGMMNAKAQELGPALHPLQQRLGDRRPGQPFVRRGARADRPSGAEEPPARADRRIAQRDPAVPDQGREALPVQQQPAAADRLSRAPTG